MDLTQLIKSNVLEEEIVYNRDGQETIEYPKSDCTIDDGTDEITQLKQISGKFFFYGSVKAKITELKTRAKNELTLVKSKTSISEELKIKAANPNARVTDKRLECLTNINPEVIKAKEALVKLEMNESNLEIILKALLLKEEELLESSRRSKQEINLRRNLVNNVE